MTTRRFKSSARLSMLIQRWVIFLRWYYVKRWSNRWRYKNYTLNGIHATEILHHWLSEWCNKWEESMFFIVTIMLQWSRLRGPSSSFRYISKVRFTLNLLTRVKEFRGFRSQFWTKFHDILYFMSSHAAATLLISENSAKFSKVFRKLHHLTCT